jgi:predicted DsbA family dithiol-disulfide isomerase
VTITWRAYPLRPELPEEGVRLEDLFSGKSIDMDAMRRKFHKTAEELGLPLGRMEKMFNSRPAQELRYWADANRAGDAFAMAVYKAYFAHDRNIAKTEVLADISESVGLCPETAVKVLESKTYASAVDADWAKAKEEEIVIAPTLAHGEWRLAGVHPYEKMADFVKKQGVLSADHETPQNTRAYR